MWESCITTVHRYLADPSVDGLWYRHADIATGAENSTVFSALAAFFLAVLVLAGDFDHEKALQESCYRMWIMYGIEPDVMNYKRNEIISPAYLLWPVTLNRSAISITIQVRKNTFRWERQCKSEEPVPDV